MAKGPLLLVARTWLLDLEGDMFSAWLQVSIEDFYADNGKSPCFGDTG